ncbi:polysaccharide deacetylase family protein [Thermoactinospora rubra]|uniref:polysaccharide deacetylase family protein n=1 Tax=Thermoactinospora rubra TaxID=1088767 RepID=UPI000A0F62E6|nr:polysaccharide deacetylase family protein [Thermoactinospora rubra]
MSRHITSLLALACVTVTLTAAPAQATPKAKEEVDCTQVKCLALTFDDGPGKYADKLLDTLKKEGVKATFFLEGQYVKSRPAFAKRMAAEGHELGNHSYTHPDFTKLEPWQVRAEVSKTQAIVKEVTGVEPKLLRPPYGLADVLTSDIAAEHGMPIILWTAGSKDWATKNEDAIKQQVLDVAKPNGIILMHDWVKQTVDVMPKIVTLLKKRGYHLVTVSTLVKQYNLRPGDVFPLPEGWQS